MKTKVAVKHSKLFLFAVFSLVTVIAIVGGFVIAANEYNVHVELNNKDVARLYNLQQTSVITKLEEFTNESTNRIYKYNFTVNRTGAPDKSLRTQSLDETHFEFVAWASTPAVSNFEYDNSDSQHQIKPHISEKETTIIAYYRPINSDDIPVKTITYKTQTGGKLSGAYMPKLSGKGVAGEYTIENPQDYIVGEDSTTYMKGISVSPIDDGYKFLGWFDESDSLVSDSLEFTPDPSTVTTDKTYTAKFENKYITIKYTADGNGKIYDIDSDTVVSSERCEKENVKGVRAVADAKYNFVGWTDSTGHVVSLNPNFVPTGDLLVDNATYTAVFCDSTDSGMKVAYLVNVSRDKGAIGRFNASNNNDLTDTIAVPFNGTISGKVLDEVNYQYDFLSVNGKKYEGDSIHPKHALTGSTKTIPYQKPTIFKAYFRPTDSNSEEDIKYIVKNSDNDFGILSNEKDYISDICSIKGSTAISTDTAQFVQWETEDGQVYSTSPTITPTALDAGKTFYAIYKSPTTGRLMYNINLTDISKEDITWVDSAGRVVDPDDYFESNTTTTTQGCIKFSDKTHYLQNEEKINILDIEPQITGYVFVGWFDKERDYTSTLGSKQKAAIRTSNEAEADKAVYISHNSSEYTIDAVWVKIDSSDAKYYYSGTNDKTINKIKLSLDTSVFENIEANDSTHNYIEQLKNIVNVDPHVTYKADVSDPEYTLSSAPTFKDAGTYTVYYKVEVNILGLSHVSIGSSKVVIDKYPITITADNQTSTYGDEIDSSDWSVKYFDSITSDSLPGPLEDDEFSLKISTAATSKSDVGDYDIDVSYDSESLPYSNYDITVNKGTLTIAKRDVTLTVIPQTQNRLYGGSNPDFDIQVEGLVNGDSINYKLSDLPAQYDKVGDYKVDIEAEPDQGNYTVKTVPGNLTIDKCSHSAITAESYNNVYDKEEHSIEVSGLIPNDVVMYSVNNKESWQEDLPKYKNVTSDGPITIYVKVTNENILEDMVEANATITITPKDVTVTAHDETISYKDNIPSFTADVDGIIDNEFSLEYTLYTDASVGSPIGDYEIKLRGDLDQGNYHIIYNKGTLTVDPLKREDLTITSYSNAYDNDSHTIEIEGLLDDDTVLYSEDGDTWQPDIFKYKDVTSKTVYVKVTNDNTEPSALEGNGKVNITPKDITITANSFSVEYNKEIPDRTAKIEGTFGEDDKLISYELSTEAVLGSPAGKYPIKVTADKIQGNYNVNTIDGEITITTIEHAPITVEDVVVEYDSNEHSINVEGLISGDKVQYSTNNVDWQSDLPKYKNVTHDGPVTIYVKVTNESTYPSELSAEGTVTINPKSVKVIADSFTIVYGEDIPKLTAKLEGVLEGEESLINYTLTTTATNTSPVETYPIIVECDTEQGNYTVTPVNGQIVITKLEHPLISVEDYNGEYDASLHTIKVSGLINGDVVSYSLNREDWQSEPFEYKDVTHDGPVTVYVRVTNSNITQAQIDDQATITITPKPITVTANSISVEFDKDIPTLTAKVEGTLEDDEKLIKYDLNTDAIKGSPIGDYKISVTADKNQGNYSVTPVDGTISIIKISHPDLILSDYNAEYDGIYHSIKIDGIIDGDNLKYSTDNTNWSDELPEYKDVTHDGPITIYVKVTNDNTLQTELNASATVTILPKQITIIVQDATMKYLTSLPKFEAVVEGLISSDNVEYTLYTDATEESEVGEYAIKVKAEKNQGNYTLSFKEGVLTISQNSRDNVVVTSYTGDYDNNPHSIKVDNTIYSDKIEYSIDDGTTWLKDLPEFVDVTNTTVYVKVTNKNTQPEVLNTVGTVVINPLSVTITADDVTANYNSAIPELTAKVEGTLDGQENLINYDLITSATVGSKIGNYPILINADKVQGNYVVETVNGNVEILPINHDNITVDSYSGSYDAQAHTVTVNGLIYGDIVEYSLDEKTWSKDPIEFVDAVNNKTIYVRVTNENTIPNVLYSSGTVTINKVQTENPPTGDNITLFVIIFVLSILGFGVTLKLNKSKN